jgi:DNA-binding transcriptional MerR regulator
MTIEHLTIGTLAAHTHCNVPTIRYYEEIGLMPPAARGSNGRRYYRDADLKRLTFIKRCRESGFPIDRVRSLLMLFNERDRSCIEVRDMAQSHLHAMRTRLDELHQLEVSLAVFVNGCDEACSDGLTGDCTIIKDLSLADTKLTPKTASPCCPRPSEPAPTRPLSATELKRA